jgi:acyl-CoA dehydrogenase
MGQPPLDASVWELPMTTTITHAIIVEQAFREIRAFRIYDGPTEVHKWSLAKKIKRDWKAGRH